MQMQLYKNENVPFFASVKLIAKRLNSTMKTNALVIFIGNQNARAPNTAFDVKRVATVHWYGTSETQLISL